MRMFFHPNTHECQKCGGLTTNPKSDDYCRKCEGANPITPEELERAEEVLQTLESRLNFYGCARLPGFVQVSPYLLMELRLFVLKAIRLEESGLVKAASLLVEMPNSPTARDKIIEALAKCKEAE